MGPSGCGKTTLMRHLVDLQEPTRGRIIIDGLDVYDNVAAGLRRAPVPDDAVHRRVTAALDALGLTDHAAHLPGELPAHTRRRVALARAVVQDADVIVIDDLDVAIDSVYGPSMMRMVRQSHERNGGTYLLTTHDIAVARSIADNLAILCNGRITTVGPPGALLDGVPDGAEFDRRFNVLDFVGPLRSDEVEDLRPGQPRFIQINIMVVWFLIAALSVLILAYALFDVTR